MSSALNCWTITNGSAGMESQVRGVAEALLPLLPDLKLHHLIAQRRKPWKWLPNRFHKGALTQLTKASDPLSPPWPDVLITSGRQAAALALEIKRLSQGKTFIVHTQKPYVHSERFDSLLLPEHDRLSGPHIFNTRWALHKVTNAKLARARTEWQSRFTDYPGPYLAVLLGGSTNKYTLSEADFSAFLAALDQMVAAWQGSILITPSRRTGEEQIKRMQEHYLNNKRVYIYDLAGDNPYMGMLALADSLAVTNDSVNMISEACYTGKPVYIIPFKGHSARRPQQFIDALVRDGFVRYFTDSFASWNYQIANDTERAASWLAAQILATKRL